MALPPAVVGLAFLVCVLGALAFMAYLAWRGAKPTDFFTEAVASVYELEMPDKEIDTYYTLKESLQKKYAPESLDRDEDEAAEAEEPWTRKVPVEERQSLKKALMLRLVAVIGKLDQVQKDKPGNWKLWQTKLVSERYWGSFCDAEKAVSQEVDYCVAEAQEIEPGWKGMIFQEAVHWYKMQKQQQMDMKAGDQPVKNSTGNPQTAKNTAIDEKKQKEKEVKRAEVEKKLEEEEKIRQEKLAEKMMQKLLMEEERSSKAKAKAKSTSAAAAKPKAKKK